MNRIAGKRILITGASSGIGEACARRFAADGARLILWARRLDRLTRLADELERARHGHVHVAQVDVRDRGAILASASSVLEAGHVPDVLINNAGLASGFDKLQDGNVEDWDAMIDTNIKGLLYVTRAFLPAMIERDRGHIVNLASTAAHLTYPRGNVYAATKAAVRSLTDGINLDVAGTSIRVSTVEPGYVETEFAVVRFAGDEARAKKVYEGFRPLSAEDVADVIAYIVNLPDHVNVFDVILMPTAQRNVYVVDRKGMPS
jgi:serine 3-dehydrogenase